MKKRSSIDPDAPGDMRSGTSQPLSDVPASDAEVAWAMVEGAPDALVMADEHGVIELVNSQAEALFGYDRVELLGRPVEMLLPEHLGAVHAAHRTRFRAAPEIRAMGSGMDLWATRADGSDVPVEVSLSPLEVAGELRVIAAIRDISERRAAEHEAAIVRHSINSVSDAVFVCEPDTLAFIHVNQGALDLHGYTSGELLAGMTPADLAPDLPAAQLRELLEHLEGAPHEYGQITTKGRSKNGDQFDVDVRINWPAPTSHTSSRPIVAVVRDVSERVRAEATARAADERFRAAFGDGPVAMTLTEVSPTADRIILEANQAMADLVGYTVDELVGMSVVEFNHPDDLEADDEATAAQTSGEQEHFAGRKRYIRKDGTVVWVHLSVRVLSRDGDTVTAIAHSIDITADVEAETRQIRQQRALEALGEIRAALLADIPLPDAFELICRRASELVQADLVTILRQDAAGQTMQPMAYDSTNTAENFPHALAIDGPFLEVLDGTPWSTANVADTETLAELHRDVATPTAGPLILTPVMGADGVRAVLLVGRVNGAESFGRADVDAITSFTDSVGSALQLHEARSASRTAELLEDRERIGRDMHDKVIGQLFATCMALQGTVARVSDEESRARLEAAVDDIDDSIKEIRSTIYGLRSRLEWGKGPSGEILAIAADTRDALGSEPSVHLSGPVDSLPAEVVEDLLSSLREALTNTIKYAQATHVEIGCDVNAAQVCLTVTDDGIGFDPEGVACAHPHGGNGLDNMRTRAQRHGGDAHVRSAPSSGTTCEWTVPLH